ncbi:NAD-dependent epimerase/dehydratase family protein [Paenibacillus agricola]|uniref:NAD(P)-dependent oxidoreductase n=1 Tax=Paenibacillus agricola TaxID=2716264 RepID=A0ABX0JC05_9BACL|nr:NAD(P)-dependent oxidoreductase [Paenibacillus agricola]NHN34042.1 NAD(P)-dependent oxidoreductase [Paenibacillus agricola]
MKVVAVTGANGRLGSQVAGALLEKGYKVIAIDQHPMKLPKCTCLQVNLVNFGEVVSALAGADAVVHLAAIPAPRGFTNEVVFASNVLSTYHVLEAATLLGITKVVSASSESSYGYAWAEKPFHYPYFPVDESFPQLPEECYGLSKIVNEATAAMFHRKNGMQITSLRFSWIVTLDKYEQIEQNASDPGEQKSSLWSYIDIRDAASACLAALEKDHLGCNDLNITADDTLCEMDTQSLISTYYPDVAIRESLEGHQALVSNAKAKQVLGWHPQFSWRQQK